MSAVPAALLQVLVGDGLSYDLSILGLHTAPCWSLESPWTGGEPGWYSMLFGSPSCLCLEVGQPHAAILGQVRGRIFVTPRLELHLWRSPAFFWGFSPCLSLLWEAIESVATSKLGILFWLSLLFPVWTRVGPVTSTVSPLIIGMMAIMKGLPGWP